VITRRIELERPLRIAGVMPAKEGLQRASCPNWPQGGDIMNMPVTWGMFQTVLLSMLVVPWRLRSKVGTVSDFGADFQSAAACPWRKRLPAPRPTVRLRL